MYACSINGKLCTGTEASVSVMDHGFLYGDGIFEGLRFYQSKIFRLDKHLERLENSAKAIGLDLPMDRQAIISALGAAIEASSLVDGYIRLIVTRGNGALGINPLTCSDGKTIIIVDELQIVSKAAKDKGAKLIIASTRRFSADQLDPRIKSLNYLNQIMAKREALTAGADEAIILNQQGNVAEGSADNIFIIKNGALRTPPTSDGALAGITRAVIMEIAEQEGIDCAETTLAPYDLLSADECFLTGTGAELIPVASINGTNIGHTRDQSLHNEKRIFEKLLSAFIKETVQHTLA